MLGNHPRFDSTHPFIRPSKVKELVLEIIESSLNQCINQDRLPCWSLSTFSQLIHHIALLFPSIDSKSSNTDEELKLITVRVIYLILKHTPIGVQLSTKHKPQGKS